MCRDISQNIEEAEKEIDERVSQMKRGSKEVVDSVVFSEPNEVPYFTNMSMVSKIFGRDSYRYKLKL